LLVLHEFDALWLFLQNGLDKERTVIGGCIIFYSDFEILVFLSEEALELSLDGGLYVSGVKIYAYLNFSIDIFHLKSVCLQVVQLGEDGSLVFVFQLPSPVLQQGIVLIAVDDATILSFRILEERKDFEVHLALHYHFVVSLNEAQMDLFGILDRPDLRYLFNDRQHLLVRNLAIPDCPHDRHVLGLVLPYLSYLIAQIV
jgi:hypothetical protein